MLKKMVKFDTKIVESDVKIKATPKKGLYKETKLLNKYKVFVNLFFVHNENATRAYLDYKNGTVTEGTARNAGARLLAKANVRRLIELKRKELESDTKAKALVTREDLVKSNIEARKLAERLEKPEAVIKANEAIAKLLGLNEAEKFEVKNLDNQVKNNEVSTISQTFNTIVLGQDTPKELTNVIDADIVE